VRFKPARVALSAFALLALAACSSSNPSQCTGTTTTLTVFVTDSSCDGSPVCGATVTATAGGKSTTLKPNGAQGTMCVGEYVGNVEAGTYTIAATAPKFVPYTTTLMVQTGCSITVTLDVMSTN
jgi:hypothetical protein